MTGRRSGIRTITADWPRLVFSIGCHTDTQFRTRRRRSAVGGSPRRKGARRPALADLVRSRGGFRGGFLYRRGLCGATSGVRSPERRSAMSCICCAIWTALAVSGMRLIAKALGLICLNRKRPRSRRAGGRDERARVSLGRGSRSMRADRPVRASLRARGLESVTLLQSDRMQALGGSVRIVDDARIGAVITLPTSEWPGGTKCEASGGAGGRELWKPVVFSPLGWRLRRRCVRVMDRFRAL